jgi:hypothetical protein
MVRKILFTTSLIVVIPFIIAIYLELTNQEGSITAVSIGLIIGAIGIIFLLLMTKRRNSLTRKSADADVIKPV